MHDSSLRKIEAFCRDYLGAHRASALEIVDLGARNVDGMRTYRRFFDAPAWRYRGLDIEPGPNVDLVVADPYRWDGLPESSIDVLISGQTLEHVEFPWLTMEQIARVLRGGGVACLVVPSAGPEHRHPVDCWRFYPDGMRALARHAALAVVEVFTRLGPRPVAGQLRAAAEATQRRPGDSALPVFEDRKLAERQYRDPQSRGGEVLPGFYAHLDLIEARGGDLAAAAAVLREGLARFPDNAYLRQRQVGVLCALGSPGAALEPALQLLGITPIGPGALRNVELMLRKLNAGEQGYFERGLDTLKPATLGRIGEACFSEQCFTLGSCAWASLLRRRPGELDYRLHRAVALLGTAQRAAGLQALAEARERNSPRDSSTAPRSCSGSSAGSARSAIWRSAWSARRISCKSMRRSVLRWTRPSRYPAAWRASPPRAGSPYPATNSSSSTRARPLRTGSRWCSSTGCTATRRCCAISTTR
ncbi:MAG: methyltransferase domain-containing protein [Gammaproteobacteria bacterium]|nr:methyltransferase domain-containing protein [Gammaproteobacteria bacterium]